MVKKNNYNVWNCFALGKNNTFQVKETALRSLYIAQIKLISPTGSVPEMHFSKTTSLNSLPLDPKTSNNGVLSVQNMGITWVPMVVLIFGPLLGYSPRLGSRVDLKV